MTSAGGFWGSKDGDCLSAVGVFDPQISFTMFGLLAGSGGFLASKGDFRNSGEGDRLSMTGVADSLTYGIPLISFTSFDLFPGEGGAPLTGKGDFRGSGDGDRF